MLTLLKKHFGYDQFRPLQGEVIAHAAAGGDALVLMPTGGGKSLCYQLPALTFPGLTVVVSPLIALMKDQVDALTANGIPAAFLNSSQKFEEAAEVARRVANGEIKLLYLAPERLAMPRVLSWLQAQRVSLFAVDEAHCISEWGHDFRPEYRMLRSLRSIFPTVPMLALTATANPRVRDDIIKQLALERGRVFQSSFNRPNLAYRVLPKKKSFERLLAEVAARPGQPVIVYCFSRASTEKIAENLKANGIKAAAYHAGLNQAVRSKIQEDFIRDRVPVIAATIAFGMGIDKPDVRLVVHMDLPKSVEGYYQETGRAGRDGLPSDCLLFFSTGDRIKQEYFIREMADPTERERARQQLDQMMRYGELATCRRAYLLHYFGEAFDGVPCGGCDVCVPIAAAAPVQMASARKEGVEPYDEELFQQLRALRRRLAEERGVPPYVIFGDRSLQEMARCFPQSMDRMARVFGVGKEKLAQYGAVFVEAVRGYAEPAGIEERESTAEVVAIPSRRAPKVKRALTETILASVERFKQQRTFAEIAAERGLAVSTIVGHIEEAHSQGVVLDFAHVSFPDQSRFAQISAAFQELGMFSLTPVRERLGESFGFDELRLARFLLRIGSTS